MLPHVHPVHAKGHALVRWRPPDEDRKCDYCGSALQANADVWSCQPCGYDLCTTCYSCPHAELWKRLLLHSTDPPAGFSEAERASCVRELEAAVDAADGEGKLWARLELVTAEEVDYKQEHIQELEQLRTEFVQLRGEQTHPDVLEVRTALAETRKYFADSPEEYGAVITERREIWEAYCDRDEDFAEEELLGEMRLAEAMAAAALDRGFKSDRSILREAASLLRGILPRLQDLYAPDTEQFWRVVRISALLAEIDSQLYLHRRAEVEHLQALAAVLQTACKAHQCTLELKGRLAERWQDAGYHAAAAKLRRWLQEASHKQGLPYSDSDDDEDPVPTEQAVGASSGRSNGDQEAAASGSEPKQKRHCCREVALPCCKNDYRCFEEGCNAGPWKTAGSLTKHYGKMHSNLGPQAYKKGNAGEQICITSGVIGACICDPLAVSSLDLGCLPIMGSTK
jgi:hypothetical protein